jgi:hemerythrin-like metal-binding protein
MDTVNELRQAMVQGSVREAKNALLDRLIEFTRMHFSSEEQLMEQSGFPGLAMHRAEHLRLFGLLPDTAHRFQHGEAGPIHSLLCQLRNGFMDHIAGEDQQYGPWLNERGVY